MLERLWTEREQLRAQRPYIKTPQNIGSPETLRLVWSAWPGGPRHDPCNL